MEGSSLEFSPFFKPQKMSDQKVYVGNAKVIKTQFGELTKMSLTAEDVEKLQQNLDNGWINVVIK